MVTRRLYLVTAFIIGLYLTVGALYSVVTPVMEAPDEVRHYPYVKHLADGNALPVQHPGVLSDWEQEGSQPPLYYALCALLTRSIDTDDLALIRHLNPHAFIGIPLATDNKNVIIHTEREAFPWRGATLAIHVLRFFSLLLSAGAVVCTFMVTRLLQPSRPGWALAAMAFHAFNPMFLFISASVNNDNLNNLLAGVALLIGVIIIQRGIKRRWLPAIGLLLGAACLTKLSGLALVPLTITALFTRQVVEYLATAPERREPWSKFLPRALGRLIIDSLLVILPVLLVSGWWYARNYRLYGDFTGLNAMLAVVGGRTIPVRSFADFWGEFRGLRYSFWGLFGAVNILMRPAWVYYLLDILVVSILATLVWKAARMRRPVPPELPAYSFLAFWILVYLVSLLRWTSMTMASQGRLLFVALPAVSLLSIAALSSFPLAAARRWLLAAACALLFVLAVSSPFASIIPAYTPPPAISQSDIPPTAQAFNAEYGGVMRLLATEINTKSVDPGGTVRVTLYWQVLAPMDEYYSVYTHVYGLGQKIIGQRDSYPGGGLLPTTSLKAGQIFGESYSVPISKDARGPVAARIAVGLYQLEQMRNLPVRDSQHQEVNWPVIGRVRIAAETRPFQASRPLDANFGNHVRLTGYDIADDSVRPGELVSFTVYWNVMRPMSREYTVFVHLLDDLGNQWGSGDGPPMADEYPTLFWTEGDWLADQRELLVKADVPAGSYRLVVGLYDPVSGERLPILNSKGLAVSDYVVLGSVRVER